MLESNIFETKRNVSVASKITLAAALIVKNEEHQIEECLQCLKCFVDEIVVLDGGSTDNTVEIARRFTGKVFINTHWKGYGIQRQRAQHFVESDWILWVDADERVDPQLAEEIQSQIEKNPIRTVFSISRLTWVFGHPVRYCGWYPDRVLRLHPKDLTHYNNACVHEKLVIKAGIQVQELNRDLLHFTYTNLHHYLTKSANYADLWAQERFQQGCRASLWQASLHGLACFLRMFILRRGFLDGRYGFLLSLLSAHSTFAKYAALWVMIKIPPPKAKSLETLVTDR